MIPDKVFHIRPILHALVFITLRTNSSGNVIRFRSMRRGKKRPTFCHKLSYSKARWARVQLTHLIERNRSFGCRRDTQHLEHRLSAEFTLLSNLNTHTQRQLQWNQKLQISGQLAGHAHLPQGSGSNPCKWKCKNRQQIWHGRTAFCLVFAARETLFSNFFHQPKIFTKNLEQKFFRLKTDLVSV